MEERLHRRGRRVTAGAGGEAGGTLVFFEKLPEGTTIIHLLEKAGDVVFAAGGPGERVGVGGDVGGHQLGRLVAFGAAGVPDPVVVHPKTATHKIKSLGPYGEAEVGSLSGS